MKKLICADDIEKLVKQGENTLCVEPGMIVTPAAKDAAKAAKLTLCEGKTEAECIACKAEAPACTPEGGCDTPAGEGEISSDTIYVALKSMMNKGLLKGIITDDAPAEPYSAETGGGVKLVRGKSVTMDVLDTGTPEAKASFREVVGDDDGAHVGAGFLEIDASRFEWVMEGYEEIDYVIEGTLTVSIDNRTFTAKAGDVFFVPSGAKVVWGSPDKARVFFATYVVE
ncbi:cupin domain-containing protein [Desulfoluna spongiiphila]|uniref:Ethanolamine utilization protein EutQ n=1 Tax=Desulfoluna spongiiphila TaxID=419481 RepID=A0A1G5JLK5_9BACT|nr:cupin domain-containing protein [Desulfoluna spongiiphila]SCY89243.1 ethanolamine utilization protein EutQ [Desulfoluna spongiiphila]VVS91707.1 ethanolamine utilisation eutq [Desulfoluna spongiiphila]